MDNNLLVIWQEHDGRRDGLIALIQAFGEFYRECFTENQRTLCLFSTPTREWQLLDARNPHVELPDYPELFRGINLAVHLTNPQRWLDILADQAQLWLFATAFHLANSNNFNQEQRAALFNIINGYPSLFDLIHPRRQALLQIMDRIRQSAQGGEYQEVCEVCWSVDDAGAGIVNWVPCDSCYWWYHNTCVGLPPQLPADQHFICPLCNFL